MRAVTRPGDRLPASSKTSDSSYLAEMLRGGQPRKRPKPSRFECDRENRPGCRFRPSQFAAVDLCDTRDDFQSDPETVGPRLCGGLFSRSRPAIFDLDKMRPDPDDDMSLLRGMANGIFDQITEGIAQQRRNSLDDSSIAGGDQLKGMLVLVNPRGDLFDGKR